MDELAGPSHSNPTSLSKKPRPPNLSFTPTAFPTKPVTTPDLDSATEDDTDGSSPSPTSSTSSSPVDSSLSLTSDATSDDFSKDLAVLERLRRSVRQNLRLRPIRSHGSLPSSARSPSFLFDPSSRSSIWSELNRDLSPSPTSSLASPSVYYTPSSEPRQSPFEGLSAPLTFDPPTPPPPSGMSPSTLYTRLTSPCRPLVIDTRPVSTHLTTPRLHHSLNLAIPSLILKRCRKPAGAFHSLDALRQFITTDDGKRLWDEMLSGHQGLWDGDVVVFDDTMDESVRNNPNATAWALLSVLAPLVNRGSAVDYLKGGLSSALSHPDLRTLLIRGGDHPDPLKKPGGLFQLDTQTALRSKALPQIEHLPSSPPDSPSPSMPSIISSSSSSSSTDLTPSPPPSQSVFRRPPPPRKPSVPTLRRIDTSSAERLKDALPKLNVHTQPRPRTKSNTLAAPPLNTKSSSSTLRSNSPSHLNLKFSNHSPPGSARWIPPPSPNGSSSSTSSEFLPPPSPYFARSPTPSSPRTPMPRSPSTARPDSSNPPTTEEPFPLFTVSTILPNFLYLGPELTEETHVEELKSRGVTRILNIAAECDDDHGLNLKERFDRYIRIPMRDTVEEDNISRGVRQVCDILDDARLHSAPTYVHCKAGKSRSVTAVMAYLIHANHWTLSRAYTFVLERRKGISPNIGFVSELMNFEEAELGSKSVGVVKPGSSSGEPSSAGPAGEGGSGGGGGNMNGNYTTAATNRRGGHMRESLPPGLLSQAQKNESEAWMPAVGDAGQETEIKDAEGRYRHARRAPVNEATLQPMRRVSKAGLESAVSV